MLFRSKVTDAGVTALGAGCGLLQSINFWDCNKVTDAGISALSAGCGKLRSINVGGCNKVTDACLMSLLTRNQFMTYSRCYHSTAINVVMT